MDSFGISILLHGHISTTWWKMKQILSLIKRMHPNQIKVNLCHPSHFPLQYFHLGSFLIQSMEALQATSEFVLTANW